MHRRKADQLHGWWCPKAGAHPVCRLWAAGPAAQSCCSHGASVTGRCMTGLWDLHGGCRDAPLRSCFERGLAAQLRGVWSADRCYMQWNTRSPDSISASVSRRTQPAQYSYSKCEDEFFSAPFYCDADGLSTFHATSTKRKEHNKVGHRTAWI